VKVSHLHRTVLLVCSPDGTCSSWCRACARRVDSGFIIGVSLIILVTGAFSAWAFRLLRGMGKSAV